MRTRMLTPALLLAALACDAGEPTRAIHPDRFPVPGSHEMAIGDSAQLEGTPYTLEMLSLETDSRCPAEADCIWAGEVKVRAALHADPGLGIPDMELTLGTTSATVAGGVSLQITSVAPVAHAGVAIPASAYRLTITADQPQ